MAHTKGEWKVNKASESKITIVSPWNNEVKPGESSGYGDYRGLHICYLEHQKDNPCVSEKQAEANAKRIVQCVNSHDKLVEACEEALITEKMLMENQSCFRSLKTIGLLEQAISKAKAK